MTLLEIAEWLEEMESVAPGLQIKLAMVGGNKFTIYAEWRREGCTLGCAHMVDIIEMRDMRVGHGRLFAQIRRTIEAACLD